MMRENDFSEDRPKRQSPAGSGRQFWTAITSVFCLVLVLFFGATTAHGATAEIQTIAPGQSFERLESGAVYFNPPAAGPASVEASLSAYRNDQFTPEFSSKSGANAFERGLWIAFEMEYPRTGGDTPLRGVIGLGGIFVVHPEVFVFRGNGSPVEVLASKATDHGTLAPRHLTYLGTASLDIEPGDRLLVLIHTSQADRPNIGFFREGELGSNQIVATLIKGGFTFVLLFIGVTLAVISIATGRTIGLLIAVGYCLVMIQNDASLFTTTYVGDAWLARQVWEVITLITIFYLYYCFLYSFREEIRLGTNRAYAIALGLLPLPLVWIAYRSDSTADIMWAFYLALFLFAGTITFKFDIARPLRIAAGLLVIGASLGAVLTDPFYMGRSLPDLTLEFIRELLRTMAALALLILLLVDVQRNRQERASAARERIAALEAQAETDRRLLQTERQYARARESAARRKAQLAAASHDIRQPIVGLRNALATEVENLSAPLRARLGEAIDYLEHLTEEYSDRDKHASDRAALQEEEPYSLDLITRAVGDMFGAEADKGGVRLIINGADCRTNVPALALIRATSNLVSNALRHAEARTIQLEVRHNGTCEIAVSDDGKGMDEATLAVVQQPGAKGDNSSGDGLGLAIVTDLARRYRFEFDISSEPGAGTRAVLRLPSTTS